ncbi:PREDICTED: uncharacterized protein LOC108564880 isoform X2 [Nicrophorus vespilloides]|uniref:Uncharacterized protein LOC108564880 isoform X2 n=1 Tax=Nicrophorus vespilloides TaxID=110193 RepID=A0ABM1MYB5_NICVS|nr:PREDICTED: uncharacterized protein LOC108564880 isoform X2 [Nicrophorus vespilloides]
MYETVKQTPKPRACSTVTKKKQELKPLSFSASSNYRNSLGVMSLEEVDLIPHLEVPRSEAPNVSSLSKSSAYDSLYKQFIADRTAEYTRVMHKTREPNSMNLPSKYFQPETQIDTPMSKKSMESTVSESDLVGLSDDRRTSTQIGNISQQLRNSDVSIKEIFNKYFITNSTFEEMDSDMFETAESATEKINAEEMFWRREHDLPVNRVSTFSQPNSHLESKISMGEFFSGKSDNCSLMFDKKSPESRKPVPLINDELTVVDESRFSTDGSILSISKIQNIISNGTETPNKLAEKLVKSKFSNIAKSYDNRKSLDSPNTKINKSNARKFVSTSELTCSKSMSHMDENKENKNRSINSMKSACSIETLSEIKNPLACTKSELVYGCVKVGKIATQEFVVKNRSDHKMRFQVNSSNLNYKISKLDTDSMAKVTILLHPNESRQFTITFSPTTIGVQTGKLYFYPMIKGDIRKDKQQVMNLFGYGGHSSIEMLGLPKDTSGKLWLPLGSLNSQNNSKMVKQFQIKNSGTLPGFAHLSVRSKSLYSYATINLSPSSVVLQPGQQVSIQVEYIITKDDYRIFCKTFNGGSEVTEIAHITIVFGPEVLRGRLRKLNEYVSKNNLMPDKLVCELTKIFPGECIPDDLRNYKDTVKNFHVILNELLRKEITITVEQDMDKTLCPEAIDETSQYHTLMNNYSNMTIVDKSDIVDLLTVEVSNILLTPPFKVSDSIVLSCEGSKDVLYEIKMEPEGFLKISNRRNVIKPGQIKRINLTCADVHMNDRQKVKVLIFTENSMLEVEVKIINNIVT